VTDSLSNHIQTILIELKILPEVTKGRSARSVLRIESHAPEHLATLCVVGMQVSEWRTKNEDRSVKCPAVKTIAIKGSNCARSHQGPAFWYMAENQVITEWFRFARRPVGIVVWNFTAN